MRKQIGLSLISSLIIGACVPGGVLVELPTASSSSNTVGEQLVVVKPQPVASPDPMPSPSAVEPQLPEPSVVPTGAPSASVVEPFIPPAGTLTVVERTPNSITVHWEFADIRHSHSYRIYLDGKLMAENILHDRYTFKELRPNTTYELALETVLAGSIPSETARLKLKIYTTGSGSSSSGNFSGGSGSGSNVATGGGSHPTPTPTPTPNPFAFEGKVGEPDN